MPFRSEIINIKIIRINSVEIFLFLSGIFYDMIFPTGLTIKGQVDNPKSMNAEDSIPKLQDWDFPPNSTGVKGFKDYWKLSL